MHILIVYLEFVQSRQAWHCEFDCNYWELNIPISAEIQGYLEMANLVWLELRIVVLTSNIYGFDTFAG